MNRKLKCAIIDDEPLARELIKCYVEKNTGSLSGREFRIGSRSCQERNGG